MKVEEGLFYINDIDMATYSCFLWEEHAGDHTNYDSLMKPPKMKEYTSVSYRELDGEELPETLLPRYAGSYLEDGYRGRYKNRVVRIL